MEKAVSLIISVALCVCSVCCSVCVADSYTNDTQNDYLPHPDYYMVGDVYKVKYNPSVFMRNLKTGDYYCYAGGEEFNILANGGKSNISKVEWKLWEMPDDYYDDLEHQKLTVFDKEYDIIINDKVREAYYNGEKDNEVSEIVEQAWQSAKSWTCDVFPFKIELTAAESTSLSEPSVCITSKIYGVDPKESIMEMEYIYPQEPYFNYLVTLMETPDYEIEFDPGNLNFDDVTNMLDVVTLQKHIAGYDERINIITADANLDGIIDMLDVVETQRVIAKL